MGSPVTEADVSFACNDSNGNFQHECEALRIDTADGRILAMEGRPIRLRDLRKPQKYALGRMRFGRCSLPYCEWRHHSGNIVCDSVRLPISEARRIIDYAFGSGWIVTEATIDGPFAGLSALADAKGD